MNILQKENGNFFIECNSDELIILSNALNNIPQAVDEQDYTTLIGASKMEVTEILDTIFVALRKV
jgi:hypothetical protein